VVALVVGELAGDAHGEATALFLDVRAAPREAARRRRARPARPRGARAGARSAADRVERLARELDRCRTSASDGTTSSASARA
jgi:hypothetical protein